MYLLQNIVTYKEYIKEFLNAKPLEISNTKLNIKRIKIKNLSFKYNEKYILNNFNFCFEAGKKYALKGASGSGKSTLIKILLKQIENYEGNIFVNDLNLKEINTQDLINSLTFLDNSENLFNDTVYNNITLWDMTSDENIKDILQKSDLLDIKPELLINEENSLSTGQKQKINIARHFYRNKNILITDEAFSNIDIKSAEKILQNINPDVMFINVSHNITNSDYYDQILEIKEGVLVE
ncbi:ABC transporter ATP-binding protein [Mycoplasma leonicaptivi]|uniref:ATP-binding cassette domain-containing protein n=1 Tax=Mycoplasma leonicaptivi TaxID=36742 RepID=UPI000688CDDD